MSSISVEGDIKQILRGGRGGGHSPLPYHVTELTQDLISFLTFGFSCGFVKQRNQQLVVATARCKYTVFMFSEK